MKSTALWTPPNTDATNSSGFNGLPGSGRYYNGPFVPIIYFGQGGVWWSTSSSSSGVASTYNLRYDSSIINQFSNTPTTAGYSVRCLKNSALSSSHVENNFLKIYPNPTSDEIHLSLRPGNYTIIVYNSIGQAILKENGINDSVLHLARFGKGVYIIKCFDSLSFRTETK